jgi:hypothetical protein
LSNAPNNLNRNEVVTVTNCLFKNNAKLYDGNELGIHAISCTFTEGSTFKSFRGLNTEVINCNFYGNGYSSGPAINLIGSIGPVKVKGNTVKNYNVGVGAANKTEYGMACNVITDNEFGLSHIFLSQGIMADANQGYNKIVNNSYTNYGEIIDFNGGGNALFNDQTTGGNRRILSGIFNSKHQIQCNSPVEEYYECTNNQWSEENPLAKPSSFPEKFKLEILDPVLCTGCPISVRDILPKEYKGCPNKDEIGVGYPGLLGLKAPVGRIPGEAYVDICPSCPILNTEYFIGTPLTEAITEAALLGSFSDGDNNVKSLELYRQILTYDYDDRNNEVYTRLQKAYIYAKAAASALLANNGEVDVGSSLLDIHRVYHPELFEGHNALEKLLYEMDKAEFERYFGRIEQTKSQLTMLASQTTGYLKRMLDQRIETVSNEILFLAGNIPWDDYLDSTQKKYGVSGIRIGLGSDGDGCFFTPDETAKSNTQQTHDYGNNPTLESLLASSNESTVRENTLAKVFSMIPNPATEKVLLSIPMNGVRKKIKLVDISGKEMMPPLLIENELTEFSVNEVPVGIYFVQLFENDVLVNTQKLLIIK